MPGDPRDFHREQEHPWSCIASCVAILKAWSGPDPAPTEAELLAGWSDPKTDLTHLANAGALRVWDANDLRDLDRLRAALQDMWLIVTLFPGPLTFFSLARQPALISKHGPLVRGDDPRRALGMPHAVVLVGVLEAGGFCYLDPYFPVKGQPLSLTEDELLEAWTGVVVIPTLPAQRVSSIMGV